jgi:hypothetical protein
MCDKCFEPCDDEEYESPEPDEVVVTNSLPETITVTLRREFDTAFFVEELLDAYEPEEIDLDRVIEAIKESYFDKSAWSEGRTYNETTESFDTYSYDHYERDIIFTPNFTSKTIDLVISKLFEREKDNGEQES